MPEGNKDVWMESEMLQLPGYTHLPDVSGDEWVSFLEAAQELFRLKPWSLVGEEIPFLVRLPGEQAGKVVILLGAAGEVFGLSVHETGASYRALQQAEDPSFLAESSGWLGLSFEGPELISTADLEFLHQAGWSLAAEGIYPAVAKFGPPEPGLHPPAAADIRWLAQALPVINHFFRVEYPLGTNRQGRSFTYEGELSTGQVQAEVQFPVRDEPGKDREG